MKIVNYDETFKLEDSAIDRFSEKVDEALSGIETERQNRLRIRLSLEESLLRIRDRFGEGQEVKAHIGKRLGRLVIRIEFDSEPYNPLSDEENELEDLCSTLLTAVGLSPQYMNLNGTNALQLQLLIPGMSPTMKILVAIIGGIAIGLIGNLLLSEPLQATVNETVMTPVFDMWSRILNVSSGPIIFFMVITTVINTGKISERGGSARTTIARYFIFSMIMAAIAVIISAFTFPHSHIGDTVDKETVQGILQGIAEIVPIDIFSAFAQTNTPQLIIMAFVAGAILHMIGNQATLLRKIVRQINMVGLELAGFISKLVPFFACVLLGLEIWQSEYIVLAGIGQTIILALAISFVCMMVPLIYVGSKEKVGIPTLEKKLRSPFWLTVKTGSLNAAFGKTEKSCYSYLGIDKRFTAISLPNGLVLYMPISAIGTLVFVTYTAMRFNVTTSPLWYVSAVILAVILFVATPPVPGANLLAYVAIFAQLGIPREALIDAMIFDIVFGLFASAGNQFVLQLELILQAGKMGLLDRKKLRAKIE